MMKIVRVFCIFAYLYILKYNIFMKIAFLSSFSPYSCEISEGNTRLYRALEKSNEIKAFNFSLLYPEFFFPGKEKLVLSNRGIDFVKSERILNTANPASCYFTASSINDFTPQLLLTRYWLPYLGASIGGTAKFIDKNIKKIAVVDTMRASEKYLLEEKTNAVFVKNYDAFITFNPQAKEDILQIKSDALCFEHPLPFLSTFSEKIDKNTARRMINIPANKKVILFLGALKKYKGFEELLHSFSLLNADYHLIIAGEATGGFDHYKQKINEFNIQHKVTLIERQLDNNEIPYIFSAADVLIMPYHKEISDNIINKTFAYELPMITTDVGNFRETFEKNKIGIIIENLNHHEINTAIEKYYNEGLEKIFINNIKALRYNHSWESLATMIYDIYDQINDNEIQTKF